MIQFVHPEALLLALPVLAAYRIWIWRGRPFVSALRVLLLALVVVLIAEPYLQSGIEGRDLIIVADRSRSVPIQATQRVEEIADFAASRVQPGDRVALVSFGRDAAVEVAPTESFRFGAEPPTLDPDATDFAQAIDRALSLIPPGRRGSILLVTDGENTGADPVPSARAALRRGIRIDAIALRRDGASDLAVEEIGMPGEVGVGEPFQFSAWVRTDRPQRAPVRLLRDGEVIAEGIREFRAGLNRVVFRDRLGDQGIHRYAVDVRVEGDRVPENDRAQAVVRVVGADRVLCITPGGRSDRLTEALRASGLDVVVTDGPSAPLSDAALDGFRAVVLENVPAEDLPPGALSRLASYVRDHGGGLFVTGGQASFGVGGYYRTEVERVLPVTMEVRQEQRKFALAMAVVLDRSGSMAAGVASGVTKMDLANLGTIAAVEVLGPMDEIAVIAVDSHPHVIVPLTELTAPKGVISKVRKIESGGGGIFTYTGLLAAARELRDAKALTKHIVIFADAADAEEPGDYKDFVPKLVQAGVTVSVIGLGSDTDSDADFLKDLAKVGESSCTFVSDPVDLPRVFAQQTIEVVRSSFVEQPVGARIVPDILAVGELSAAGFPGVGGYSVAYLEAGASVGLQTDDETGAPLFSFWQHGLGRSAAFLGEVDGEFSGALGSWGGYTDFFTTIVRWISGSRASGAVFADLRRRGHRAVLSVEVDADAEAELGQLEAVVVGPDGPERVWLQRVGARRLEATLPLESEGVYRAAVQLTSGAVLRVPPITLPYSPEFEPRPDPDHGMRTLERLCEVSEGRVDPPVEEWFRGRRDSIGVLFLGTWVAILALLLLLSEIAVRRLDLRLRPARAVAAPSPPPSEGPTQTAPPEEAPSEPEDTGIASVFDRAKTRRRRL